MVNIFELGESPLFRYVGTVKYSNREYHTSHMKKSGDDICSKNQKLYGTDLHLCYLLLLKKKLARKFKNWGKTLKIIKIDDYFFHFYNELMQNFILSDIVCRNARASQQCETCGCSSKIVASGSKPIFDGQRFWKDALSHRPSGMGDTEKRYMEKL